MMLRNYSIIVPFSGGVESTALVYHLKKNGYEPYCFHIKSNPGEVNTIQQKAKLLGVEVTTIHTDYNPASGYLFNREASHEHYKKTFNYNGFPPMHQQWATIAFNLAITNIVQAVYFGHNGGKLTPNDTAGDSFHEFGEAQYEGYVKAAATVDLSLSFKAPLAHLSKQEQYQMLPDQLKKLIYVCFEGNKKHCMKCSKCNELKAICTEEQLQYYV